MANQDPSSARQGNPELLLASRDTTEEFINIVTTLCAEEDAAKRVYPEHEVVVRKLHGTTRKRLKTVETEPVFITHNPDEEGNSLNIEPMFGLATLHGMARWREWVTPLGKAPGFDDVYKSLFVQPVSRIAMTATKRYFEDWQDQPNPAPIVTVWHASEAEVEEALSTILDAVPGDTKRLSFMREKENQHDSHI